MSADAAVLMLNFLQLRMHLMHFAFRLLRRDGDDGIRWVTKRATLAQPGHSL